MVSVTLVQQDGERHSLKIDDGISLMEAAVMNDVPGIIGECGGAGACATCHVYVDAAWRDRVGEPDETELDMLELAIDPDESSRLSCQIIMRPDLDGLVVTLPASQT